MLLSNFDISENLHFILNKYYSAHGNSAAKGKKTYTSITQYITRNQA